MKTRYWMGWYLFLEGMLLVAVHLWVVGDLMHEGVDPDGYALNGGSALASTYAVPMGSGAMGLGVILLFAGRCYLKELIEKPARFLYRPPFLIAVFGLLTLGGSSMKLDKWRDRIQSMENGPAIHQLSGGELAAIQFSKRKIDTQFFVGLGLTMAGLLLLWDGFPRKKEEEPDTTG